MYKYDRISRHIWLVVEPPSPLKNEGVKVTWDDCSIPTWMESQSKFHGSSPADIILCNIHYYYYPSWINHYHILLTIDFTIDFTIINISFVRSPRFFQLRFIPKPPALPQRAVGLFKSVHWGRLTSLGSLRLGPRFAIRWAEFLPWNQHSEWKINGCSRMEMTYTWSKPRIILFWRPLMSLQRRICGNLNETCLSGTNSYGHLLVISTYNTIYRMYNPIYNQL